MLLEIVKLHKIENQLKKLPDYIKIKLLAWAKAVELDGHEY
jgi:hypothetical protein